MDSAETDRNLTDPAWRRWVLLGSLVIFGLLYVSAYALFVARSENFIVAQRNERARIFSRSHPLPLPANLSFGTGEKDNSRLGGGWHLPDPPGVWSSTNDAWIELIVQRAETDIILRFHTTPFVAKRHREANLAVVVNGMPVGSWLRNVANASEPFDVRVPRVLARTGNLDVRLHTDYVSSPIRLRVGDDDRQLGVLLASIEIRSAPQF